MQKCYDVGGDWRFTPDLEDCTALQNRCNVGQQPSARSTPSHCTGYSRTRVHTPSRCSLLSVSLAAPLQSVCLAPSLFSSCSLCSVFITPLLWSSSGTVSFFFWACTVSCVSMYDGAPVSRITAFLAARGSGWLCHEILFAINRLHQVQARGTLRHVWLSLSVAEFPAATVGDYLYSRVHKIRHLGREVCLIAMQHTAHNRSAASSTCTYFIAAITAVHT